MGTIEIVFCVDHRFIMPAGVMIHSVSKNNLNQDIRFHVVVDESVTEEDKEDLREVAGRNSAQFYLVDSQAFSSMPLLPNISCATYYRLMIPQILSEEIHKVLYLDCDIIVRHSLLPLWKTNMDGYAVAAVIDNLDSVTDVYERLEYPQDLGYFNAGVLLLNLKYMRANDIHSEMMSYMKSHYESLLFSDQDILNYVLRERKVSLPVKYNLQTSFLFVPDMCCYDYKKYEQEVLEARKDPVILHYTLGKPWMEGTNHPYLSSFFRYQSETKWKGCIWKNPERPPFMVKVRSHIKRILVKLGLFKAAPKPSRVFVDLPPID